MTYYVDAALGRDTFSGTAPNRAWRTLNKVNSKTFLPGDNLLFKAGQTWTGQLHPLGSGAAGNFIKIDIWAGTEKAKIVGNGVGQKCGALGPPVAGAVYLVDQDYWEIRNLDVTNHGTPGCEIVGIKVRNTISHPDAMHIYIGNVNVHDVNGMVNGFYGVNAGIAVTSDMNTAHPSPTWPNPVWNDITIENNTLSDIDRIGIYVGPEWQNADDILANFALFPRRMHNVNIRNNTLTDIGADGILTFIASNVTIEGNVVHDSGWRIIGSGVSAAIWTAVTNNSVIQYNEVYRYAIPPSGQKLLKDGTAFDADFGTTNQVVQYNYSHDNGGGFMLFCETQPTGGAVNLNNIQVRYNISYNDGRSSLIPSGIPATFTFACGLGTFPAGLNGLDINNNLIYVSSTQNTNLFYTNIGSLPGTAYIYNNIYYVVGSGRAYFSAFPDSCTPQGMGTCFAKNVYYGNIQAGPSDYVSDNIFDPVFVNSAPPGIGRSSVDGLRLRAGSPAIASGYQPGYGVLGPTDFWFNPVPATSPPFPNRGPYNGPGL